MQVKVPTASGEQAQFVLAVLTAGKTEQVSFNVQFSSEVEFSLSGGV